MPVKRTERLLGVGAYFGCVPLSSPSRQRQPIVRSPSPLTYLWKGGCISDDDIGGITGWRWELSVLDGRCFLVMGCQSSDRWSTNEIGITYTGTGPWLG